VKEAVLENLPSSMAHQERPPSRFLIHSIVNYCAFTCGSSDIVMTFLSIM